MQFTVKQTRKDLSNYLNTRLPLIGSKRPKIIPVDIDIGRQSCWKCFIINMIFNSM